MMKQVAFALMIGAQLVAATGENPICFVCGSKYATITNHTAVVQISPEFNLNVTEITCELLSMAGQRKYIPVNACAAAKKSKELKTVCGCTELKKTSSKSPLMSSPQLLLAANTRSYFYAQ